MFYTQAGGEYCDTTDPKNKKNYTFSVEVFCNADGGKDDIVNQQDITINATDKCNPSVSFKHKNGCPVFSATSWVRFLVKNPYILGTIAIIVGAIITYYGRKFFPWVIGIVGGGLIFLCLMLLCSVMGMLTRLEGNDKGSIPLVVLAFVGSAALGAAAGFVLAKLLKLGAMVLGAFAGFFLGSLIYNLAFYWSHNIYALCALSFGTAIIVACIAFKFYDIIIIFGTALIGSYAFVRGIANFAGHYPNEIVLYGELANNIKPTLEW